MKSFLPFFFKRTFLLFEILALIGIGFVVFFFYTHFYRTTVSNPSEESTVASQESETINITLYQDVIEEHKQKSGRATLYEGYSISSPFQHIQAPAEDEEETVDVGGQTIPPTD